MLARFGGPVLIRFLAVIIVFAPMEEFNEGTECDHNERCGT